MNQQKYLQSLLKRMGYSRDMQDVITGAYECGKLVLTGDVQIDAEHVWEVLKGTVKEIVI